MRVVARHAEKTWSPEIHIRETEQEIIDGGSRSFIGEEFESWRAGNLVGTPEQVGGLRPTPAP